MCLCRPSEKQQKKVLNINWTWAKLVFDNQYLFFDFTTDKLIIFPQFLLCHYVACELIHLYVWCFVNKSSFSFSISFRLVIAIYLCFLLNPITATTEKAYCHFRIWTVSQHSSKPKDYNANYKCDSNRWCFFVVGSGSKWQRIHWASIAWYCSVIISYVYTCENWSKNTISHCAWGIRTMFLLLLTVVVAVAVGDMAGVFDG